jgi:SAM-dependent methyltransferase
MERQAWLAERRAALAADYDADAASYGDEQYPWDMQRAWVARVLRLIPPAAVVLDAPCGTGKYFPMLAAAGVRVAGTDQSAGMLARAAARGIACSLEHTSLQELSYAGQFDAVLTIDAMQHIPPEDWPLVLANVHRATRPGGLVYLTVHELPEHHLGQAFASLCARGQPAVRGEVAEPETPGYHYCPGRDQAVSWFGQQGLAIADEGFRRENGWGYRHFLLRAGPALPAS